MDLMSATLAVLSCEFLLPNFFAVAFWFPACEGFTHYFGIASGDCALKAISLRSACGLENLYFPRLWQIEVSTPSMKILFWLKSS